MPTVLQLAAVGALTKVDAGLSWREQEERLFYATPKVIRWFEQSLPQAGSDWQIERSPLEQLDTLLRNFCSGQALVFERQIKPIRHIDKGIWELKTADLRLFGWFPIKDCFIATAADLKTRIKEHNLVSGYRDEAVITRNQIQLDEPKFIAGDNPDDVISSCCYPAS